MEDVKLYDKQRGGSDCDESVDTGLIKCEPPRFGSGNNHGEHRRNGNADSGVNQIAVQKSLLRVCF